MNGENRKRNGVSEEKPSLRIGLSSNRMQRD
jgi:hypothetical protein